MKPILGLSLILILQPIARADEHDHRHGREHANEMVAPPAGVGPEKGVLAANEEDGFRPSESVRERFGVVVIPLAGPGPWRVGRAAILLSREEKSLYRERGGFFRRVDYTETGEAGSDLLVKSAELEAGDGIAVGGIGFLRAIELTVFAKEPAGHSH